MVNSHVDLVDVTIQPSKPVPTVVIRFSVLTHVMAFATQVLNSVTTIRKYATKMNRFVILKNRMSSQIL